MPIVAAVAAICKSCTERNFKSSKRACATWGLALHSLDAPAGGAGALAAHAPRTQAPNASRCIMSRRTAHQSSSRRDYVYMVIPLA
eukprot:165828-Pyramimonas_sp.AAC.1